MTSKRKCDGDGWAVVVLFCHLYSFFVQAIKYALTFHRKDDKVKSVAAGMDHVVAYTSRTWTSYPTSYTRVKQRKVLEPLLARRNRHRLHRKIKINSTDNIATLGRNWIHKSKYYQSLSVGSLIHPFHSSSLLWS